MAFLSRVRGARRQSESRRAGAPTRYAFADALREHEEQRHAAIVTFDAPRVRSSLPRGWRPEDVLGAANTRGFVPLADAAAAMRISERDVIDAARRGLLLAELRGATLYVQPALVGVTRVERRDA